MRVVAYTRVSTEEQATQGVSLAAQESKLRAYCELYGHDLVELIVDAGVSAKNLNRPGLQQALSMLRGGEAQGVLVLKLDRLTRSVRDLGELLEHYFQQNALLSVQEQCDTSSAAGRLVLNMLMSVAQWEREVNSERTKTALAHKRAEGQQLGAPSLGSVDSERVTLDRIFALAALGRSLREICSTLEEEGYLTKRGGNKWEPTTVRRYLMRNRQIA